VPLAAIFHSPLLRAVQTSRMIAESLPGVPIGAAEELGDYLPPVPDAPSAYAGLVERFAIPSKEKRHELIVTHNFLVAWFVRDALGAPPARWLGLNQGNCALTVIRYRPDRPPALITFNDGGHLPPELRT
jgi:serine/threonine-protein phosphatase PGAM5